MYLLRKTLFILLFLSFFSINHLVFGQATTNEYILKTDDMEELIKEFPIVMEDEIVSRHIYKIFLKEQANETLDTLENDPRVISLSPNQLITTPPIIELPYSLFKVSSLDSDWGFKSMNFPQTTDSMTTIDVAVLDTGIDTDHPLLKDSIKNGYDALLNSSIEDENGHGTHVAGIIAMKTPQLNIIPIKTLDKVGKGDVYAFLRGFYYAIENKADVINMSFGIGSDDEMVQEAISEAISNGITVVAASGNSGAPYLQYPARYAEVIAVGAYDKSEVKASFSQYGDQLDFVAPGVDIWSSSMMGEYELQSGTSMATPFITKTVALLKSINPQLSNVRLEEILQTSASPLKGETIRRTGHGKVDVAMALKLAEDEKNDYNYFPQKFDVPAMKDWKIKLSLPIDADNFETAFIYVIDREGKEVETSIQLDEMDRRIIHVLPPSTGYDLGGNYELVIKKGLISENGRIGTKETRMKFNIEG